MKILLNVEIPQWIYFLVSTNVRYEIAQMPRGVWIQNSRAVDVYKKKLT